MMASNVVPESSAPKSHSALCQRLANTEIPDAVESWLTMNDQRMLLQLPNYFSNLTNVGKTLTANLGNIGKMLVLNIGPELCEVDSTILPTFTLRLLNAAKQRRQNMRCQPAFCQPLPYVYTMLLNNVGKKCVANLYPTFTIGC